MIALVAGCSKPRAADPLINEACEGNAQACEQFVKGGLPVDVTDEGGVTALDWAVFSCKPNVVQKLIELGADVNHVDRQGFTPLMYTATPLRGHRLNGTQEQRNLIAELLMEHGADVNRAMGDGHASGSAMTTLHFAVSDKNVDLVRMLLAAGANPNAKESHGWTPLDVAKFPDFAPNDEVISELEKPKAPTTSR
jgi:ankyrin repeat protein